MKISIITACYNSSLTILDAIESVNKQSYADIEHIFIDGVSNDNTTEIIRLNSKKTKLIISEEDSGLYDAINKGVLNATGDIIALLHSDDIFSSSEIISDLMKKIQNENLDGVYGDLLYVDKINTNKIIRFWKSCEFNSNLLVKGWMPAHPTLILRKEVYIKHGVFNKSFKIAADYDFMLRILKDSNLKFGYLPKVVTKMRVGGASNRSIKNIINKSKEDYRAICSNNIGGIITLLLKNTSKIKQFLIKKS
jgi:glycosyltransferase involved in cell wall biosynthesis